MKALVFAQKGSVDFIDPSSGEVEVTIPVHPGVYPLSQFARFRPSGAALQVCGGRVITSRGNMELIKAPGRFESAANPSFRMTPAMRQVIELKRLLKRNEALEKRTARMVKHMQRARPAPRLTLDAEASEVARPAPRLTLDGQASEVALDTSAPSNGDQV